MPNGNMTTKEYLHRIDQRLNDFLEYHEKEKVEHDKQDKEYRDDHKDNHKLLWKFLIGIPVFIVAVFALVEVLRG